MRKTDKKINEDDIKTTANNIIDKLITVLKDKYKILLTRDNFLIQNGSRKGKISMHIKCPTIKFKNMYGQETFWVLHRREIDESIDMSVYWVHMPLKLVHCNKWKYLGNS